MDTTEEDGIRAVLSRLRRELFEVRWAMLERKWRVDQARVPAGAPEGGRWTAEGGAATDSGRLPSASGKPTAKEVDDAVAEAHRTGHFGGVPIDYSLEFPKEQSWAVYEDGEVEYEGVHGVARGNIGVSRFTPSKTGYIAIVHSHPDWAGLEPGPDDHDPRVPKYGIGREGAWVVRPGERRARRLRGSDPYH